jgi:hypothetical protein
MTALRALEIFDKSPYMERGTNAREQFFINQSEARRAVIPGTEILPQSNQKPIGLSYREQRYFLNQIRSP